MLLIREGARDFRTGETATDQNYFEESVNIHHVFPKKWCQERQPERVPASLYDSVVNKSPLTARTNRIIGGRAPSDYLRSLQFNHGITPEEQMVNVGSHLIDLKFLAEDDSEGYFQVRRAALLHAIESVMGKPTREDPTQVVTTNLTYEDLGPEDEDHDL